MAGPLSRIAPIPPGHITGDAKSSALLNSDYKSQFSKPGKLLLRGSALWSGMRDVVVEHPFAYCAMTNGLMILDIGAGLAPTIVSLTPLNVLHALAVQDGFVYAASNDSGLVIFDVSDKASPRIVGRLREVSRATDIELLGNHLYLATNSKFLSIDVSKPGNLSIVGEYLSGNFIWDLTVGDSLAFVVNGNRLEVIDISDPKIPFLIDSFTTPGKAVGVYLDGQKVYVTDGPHISPPCIASQLHVFSLSVSNSITLLGSTLIRSGGVGHLRVKDNIAFITNGFSGLSIVDVTNPLDPSVVGVYSAIGFATGIDVRANRAYLSTINPPTTDGYCSFDFPDGETPGSFHVIDVTEISSPNRVRILDSPDFSTGLVFAGERLYVTNSRIITHTYGGINTVDVSDAKNPIRVSNYRTFGATRVITAEDSLLCFAASSAIGSPLPKFHILNISSSGTLSELSTTQFFSFATDITSLDGVLYLATLDGLEIFDISDPTAPFLLATHDPPGGVRAVKVVLHIAYLMTGDGILEALDVSDPSSPTVIGFYDAGVAVNDLELIEGLCVLVHQSGFQLVNVSDPKFPSLLTDFTNLSSVSDAEVINDKVVLTRHTEGISVVDISDPNSPTLVCEVATSGDAMTLTSNGNEVYVADGESVLIYSFDTPTGITDSVETELIIPYRFELYQNYPNPFNPSTTISFSLNQKAHITLQVINALGQSIRVLASRSYPAGSHRLLWDGKNSVGNEVSSGIYMITISSENLVQSKKMLLIR